MADARTRSSTRYADAARRVDGRRRLRRPTARRSGPATTTTSTSLPDAAVRVSLGCGNPIAVADLQPGDTVLDLGSGGGIDVLLSARRVGPTGFVYGLDATVEMLDLARRNAAEAGASNVEFLHGTIEQIPLAGRLGRCRHLELRHRAVRRQGRHVRRDRPGPAPRRPRRDQRHRPRRPRRRHPDQRLLRRRRHHRRRLRGRPASRRPRPRLRSRSPTRSAPASPTPSSVPPDRSDDYCSARLAPPATAASVAGNQLLATALRRLPPAVRLRDIHSPWAMVSVMDATTSRLSPAASMSARLRL